MSRVGALSIALQLSVSVAGSSPSAPPVIKLALYAPPAFHERLQEAPPVDIVGSENSRSENSLGGLKYV